MPAPRNLSQARDWLTVYEKRNADLPQRDRRMLGLFALASMRRVLPRTVVEEIVGYPTSVFSRDISRRWWLVLSRSGCAKHWKHFKKIAEQDGSPIAYRWLCARISKKRREVVDRRLGTSVWRITKSWLKGYRQTERRWRWFKMGLWESRSPWTILLIDGGTLADRRTVMPYTWCHKLNRKVRLLERECYHRINPDLVSIPEAKWGTLEYVRKRIPELIGYTRKYATLRQLSWFLTVDIINTKKRTWVPPGRRRIHHWCKGFDARYRKWT